MNRWRDKLHRYMLRPFIYMTFTRFILMLFIVLMADFLLSPRAGRSLRSAAFLLGGLICGILAWIVWMRLDGMKLPRLLMMRINPRKKPSRMYGDMIDYVDEQPQVTFEDLEDDEKDLCILGADLFCFAVFLVISLIV